MYTAEHHSLSAWLLLATTGCLFVLGAAILGTSYTGFHGEWLSGVTQLNNELFYAEASLQDVHLRSGSGTLRTISLHDACIQSGGRDTETSHWCALDRLGADTESLLTAAFVPALIVFGLSLTTALQNCCTGSSLRDQGVQRLGITSALYNATMLIAPRGIECLVKYYQVVCSMHGSMRH